ncbi:MAG: PQQ-binding-like beta-propeller repeat protein [Acidimicrobiia bacterium]
MTARQTWLQRAAAVSVTMALVAVAVRIAADPGRPSASPAVVAVDAKAVSSTATPDERAPTTTAAPTTPSAPTTTSAPSTTSAPTTASATTTAPPPLLADPSGFQQPWGTAVRGLLTFRGNPTRSYHGTGPVPVTPTTLWRYPGRAMCGESSEYGETRVWCGTGWTGQPVVFERTGRTWLVFGAYDYRIHFVDAATGEDIIPPFPTGDIAKGAITVDPDGYPLIYAGSRDNQFRVISFDGPEPVELWSMDGRAITPRLWNNDWDGAAIVVDDHLIVGGENSRLHLVRLYRGYGADGRVTAAPELQWSAAGWDEELLDAIGDTRVSLESSVMLLGDTIYVASSGGLVQGWDFSSIRSGIGEPTRTFRFWTGDDTDATIVGDDAGFIYVGVEVDRNTARARELGQLLKLDPRRSDDPVVWRVDVNHGVDSGTWSTPAIHGDTVIWPTRSGIVYGLDRATGAERWQLRVAGPVLSSPSVVDGVLLQGDGGGALHAYDLGDGTASPVERWALRLDGNIESTPAVWAGRIYVGTRAGFMLAVGDA